MSPQPSYPAPQGWLATPSTPRICGMASCWQINSILANNGRKNSIQIFNQYPFLWKVSIWAYSLLVSWSFYHFKNLNGPD